MGLDILICVDDNPSDQLTQLVSNVEVHEKIDQNTTYKLTFMVDVCNGDIAGSIENDTAPGKILSVLANVKNELICLVKGPVTVQNAHLQHGGAGSSLHIEGEDTARTLDHDTQFKVSDSDSDADIVRSILNKSDHEEMIPAVDDTPSSRHDEENHSHVHNETDLALIRKLAKRNGYHFWITYSKEGAATAHFKPRGLDGEPKEILIVNQENYNIDSLRISANPQVPSQTDGKQINLRNKEDIGGETQLNDHVLGGKNLSNAAGTKTQSIYHAPPVDDAGAMRARAEGALRESQWFITASCHTSLHRLCGIVQTHTIVEIQGAGTKHSGSYYVTEVTHAIDAVAHNMNVELARNGWGQ